MQALAAQAQKLQQEIAQAEKNADRVQGDLKVKQDMLQLILKQLA